MTREEFSKKIHWNFIIWVMGFVNAGAMFPQIIKILKTKNTDGLAIEMFFLFFIIQIAFSLEGYFTKNTMLMICLALSAIFSATIIFLYYFF